MMMVSALLMLDGHNASALCSGVTYITTSAFASEVSIGPAWVEREERIALVLKPITQSVSSTFSSLTCSDVIYSLIMKFRIRHGNPSLRNRIRSKV
jgi:hypothetical protein